MIRYVATMAVCLFSLVRNFCCYWWFYCIVLNSFNTEELHRTTLFVGTRHMYISCNMNLEHSRCGVGGVAATAFVYPCRDNRLMFVNNCLSRPRPPRRTSSFVVVALLLVAGVEPNPGPATSLISFVNLGLLNARSAVNKAAHIHDVIADRQLDTTVITETWIPSDAPDGIELYIAPANYCVLHSFRGSSTDYSKGGIAVAYKQTIGASVIDLGKFSEFESLFVRVNTSPHIIITVIYRFPGAVSAAFCNELTELFDRLLLAGQRYIVCGDFSCPGQNGPVIDDRLADVLYRHNQTQLVSQPTHNAGNTLDLLIVSDR